MNSFMKAMPVLIGAVIAISSCSKNNNMASATPKDPATAEIAAVDRFSNTAGHLQVRTATNGLPAANTPINFDQGPFITRGFTAGGQMVEYYNFDLQSTTPAPIWVLYRSGESTPVPGQLNIINVLPGEMGYNDFWHVFKVTVPANYVANTITSSAEIATKGYNVTPTTDLVNCPVVPMGSTATKRLGSADKGLTKGWYKGKVVFYFNFFEKALSVTATGTVPVVPIYVSFNINPADPNGGPASGFETEGGTMQTHNVVSVVPADAGYSPLWVVKVYDNRSFGGVRNLATALAAPLLVPDAGDVNCPVVSIQ